MTTKQVNMVRNPTGKGGFGDHPENRSPGGWKKENSFSYQMNRFKNMTVDDFLKWLKENPKDTRTMAEELAYARVFKARESLMEFKEVADRTEGKPIQKIESKIFDVSEELDKLESNYGELAKEAEVKLNNDRQKTKKQVVENKPLIQDKGQIGKTDNIQAEQDTTKTSS